MGRSCKINLRKSGKSDMKQRALGGIRNKWTAFSVLGFLRGFALPIFLLSIALTGCTPGGDDEEEGYKGRRRAGEDRGERRRGGRDDSGFDIRGIAGFGKEGKPNSETGVSERPAAAGDAIDILFYLSKYNGDRRMGECLAHFGQSAKENGFFSHLKEKDWQVSFSLFSENPKLFALEKSGTMVDKNQSSGAARFFKTVLILPLVLSFERNYVLTHGRYSADEAEKIFYDSITPYRYVDINGLSVANSEYISNAYDTPKLSLGISSDVDDPLAGLQKLLDGNEHGFFRESSKTFVVIIDHGRFPHYISEEWDQFFSGKQSHFIFMIPRRSAAPHVIQAIEEKEGIDWRPFCEGDQIASDLAKHIFDISKG